MAGSGLTTSAGIGADVSALDKIAREANRIYEEKFREDCERDHRGKYAAIDIRTGSVYLDDSSDGALRKARRKAPHGVFHLIRVGFKAAFKVARLSNVMETGSGTSREQR